MSQLGNVFKVYENTIIVKNNNNHNNSNHRLHWGTNEAASLNKYFSINKKQPIHLCLQP